MDAILFHFENCSFQIAYISPEVLRENFQFSRAEEEVHSCGKLILALRLSVSI